MIIIENKILPLGRYDALNLFGVIFVKNRSVMSPSLVNHEKIHSQQMRELLWVFFYITYIAEWIFRLAKYRGNLHKAYFTISFEKEAYLNMRNPNYLKTRKPFAMWR
jgi:hypothetical protein